MNKLLVGNKSDLEAKRAVTTEEAKVRADRKILGKKSFHFSLLSVFLSLSPEGSLASRITAAAQSFRGLSGYRKWCDAHVSAVACVCTRQDLWP